MQRSWYFRFILMAAATAAALLILWPSLEAWVPVPEFVRKVVTRRISPGLDISGGMRLTYDVDIGEAVRDRRDLRIDELARELGERLGVVPKGESPTREQLATVAERVKVKPEGERRIRVTFNKPEEIEKLDREFVTRYRDLREVSRKDGVAVFEVRNEFLQEIQDTAVQQARETIANRIDGLGMREASVTAQNTDIIVEVPGADQASFDRIREIVSKIARLEFQVVNDEATFVADLNDLPEGITKQVEAVSAGVNKPQVASTYLLARGPDARQKLAAYVDKLKAAGRVPEDHELALGEEERGSDPKAPKKEGESDWRTYSLFARAEVTGQAIEDAFVATDPQNNKPYVSITFNRDGAELFKQLSGRNVKRRMAIVLDDKVASAPVLQEEIGGGRCQITLGGFRPYNEMLNEAKDLVIVLKAGALPVPIIPSNVQMIGPTLGRDGVEQGVKGAVISVLIVLLFMLVYYEVGGAIANVMVLLHIVMQLAVQAFFEAALTLPGIVAIALNTGMAIDANVLVNERIREELRTGKSPRVAVEQGFTRAFSSVFDSQITTLIAAIVLFQYGTGPIKGFAVALIFGICTSLFTGIFCSRIAFDWLVRGLRVQKLRIG